MPAALKQACRFLAVCGLACLILVRPGTVASATHARTSVLEDHVLVTWYGNPRSSQMGVLGEWSGAELATGLRQQAAAYEKLTTKHVLMAYELVTVVAQCTAGRDGAYRRRETSDVIRTLLADARDNGFKLVVDVQVGRSTVAKELAALTPILAEPDVYLALDPEFAVGECETPGQHVGELSAADVNAALDVLERLIADRHLPPKVLIVHQFLRSMLPEKAGIRQSQRVDLVLNMDGFGSPALKLATYRDIMRQGQLAFAGIKLFYRQDPTLLTPQQVMALSPVPSVIIYQ